MVKAILPKPYENCSSASEKDHMFLLALVPGEQNLKVA